MGQYVARKRAKFKGFSGPVNIPWGAVLEEQDGLLFWRGAAVCGVTSQNAYDYFSRDDDSHGKLRGKLVTSIKAKLEKRDAGYQARWNKVWGPSARNTGGLNTRTGGSGIMTFSMPPSRTFGISLDWSGPPLSGKEAVDCERLPDHRKPLRPC